MDNLKTNTTKTIHDIMVSLKALEANLGELKRAVSSMNDVATESAHVAERDSSRLLDLMKVFPMVCPVMYRVFKNGANSYDVCTSYFHSFVEKLMPNDSRDLKLVFKTMPVFNNEPRLEYIPIRYLAHHDHGAPIDEGTIIHRITGVYDPTTPICMCDIDTYFTDRDQAQDFADYLTHQANNQNNVQKECNLATPAEK